ncbi:MAG: hypothetical protein CM15mP49_21370 [Actinomycetota bacterium]|nr:MAG: hypothetical protein CM15mP49_21370 [Actinomycetota bacterium]
MKLLILMAGLKALLRDRCNSKTSSGAAESADVIFSLDKETAILIHQGELTTEEAFLKGYFVCLVS